MKVLIVSATEVEITPFVKQLGSMILTKKQVDILITGVGMMATTYKLTEALQYNEYDLVLQAGVGGSFDKDLPLGSVVFITSDQYGDLGAEDHDKYIDIFELGLLNENAYPYTDGKLLTPLHPIHKKITLPQVSAITVNTVSGNEHTIKRRWEKYSCAIESMEGAAFHYVCLQEGTKFAQVRAISNSVTPRDKNQWQMKDAIINLNNWLISFIQNI